MNVGTGENALIAFRVRSPNRLGAVHCTDADYELAGL